jgi:hypothetical protein
MMQAMANNTITIPKEMAEGGDLVIIPRSKYEKLLRWQKKIKWEEKDTDEAIRIFEKERKEGKLFGIKSLAELR